MGGMACRDRDRWVNLQGDQRCVTVSYGAKESGDAQADGANNA